MKKVIVYTSTFCPFCIRAKHLLDSKGVDYQEKNIDETLELVDEVVKKSGGRQTVPQIFIGDQHVGGCDELYAFEKDGTLASMLAKL